MRVAIIIPCFNEELTIEKVVSDCRTAVPEADIFVFDNNSDDRTGELAKHAGAKVILSPLQGKGHVIRHAFCKVEADVYVMLDGDDTYPAQQIPKLIEKLVEDQLDMVIGTRLSKYEKEAFREFHVVGNKVFSWLVSKMSSQRVTDVFSGFRTFSADLVRNIPLQSRGFEVETDLTLQAAACGFAIGEVPIYYRRRPEGSFSKLKTYQDGFNILHFILKIVRDYRPLQFFSFLAGLAFLLSLVMGWAPVRDFINYSYVYTVPRAILAASLMILSIVFCGVGLILDSQIRYFQSQMQILRRHRREDVGLQRRSA